MNIDKLVHEFPHTFQLSSELPKERPRSISLSLAGTSLSAPIIVGVESGRKCQLTCPHCYSKSGPSRREQMTKDSWEKILEECYIAGVPTIYISGGEPFLHPLLESFLKSAMEGYDHTILLSTNGLFMSERVLDIIASYRNRIGIQVSFEHPNLTINERTRNQKGGFLLTDKNLKKFISMGISVSIGAVVTQWNIRGLEELITYGSENGVDEVHLMPIVPSGRGIENFSSLYPSREALVSLVQDITIWRKKYPAVNIVAGNFLYQPNHGKNNANELDGYEAGFTQAYIDFLLSVYPSDLVINDEFRAGSLHEKSLWQIWQQSPIFQRIRQLEFVSEDCKPCKYLLNCKGGDLTLRNLGEIYLERNPLCPHDPVHDKYYLLEDSQHATS